MLRDGKWLSYDKENQWMSFDALKVMHRVTPVIEGERFSITLYTPGKLERLTAQDWDVLGKHGFPRRTVTYEPLPAKMRRLITQPHVIVMALTPANEHIGKTLEFTTADESTRNPRSVADIEERLLDNIPLPSIADPTDSNLLQPKTLLDCCRCAQAFIDEHDLGDCLDAGDLNL